MRKAFLLALFLSGFFSPAQASERFPVGSELRYVASQCVAVLLYLKMGNDPSVVEQLPELTIRLDSLIAQLGATPAQHLPDDVAVIGRTFVQEMESWTPQQMGRFAAFCLDAFPET